MDISIVNFVARVPTSTVSQQLPDCVVMFSGSADVGVAFALVAYNHSTSMMGSQSF